MRPSSAREAHLSEPLAISRKLGARPGDRVVLLHAPRAFELADLPCGASLTRRARPPARPVELLVAFYREVRSAERETASLVDSIVVEGALWIAWPRRAAGHKSDLTDGVVRALGLAAGLVDVKVAALGEEWSSLRFVFPLADREAVAQARGERS